MTVAVYTCLERLSALDHRGPAHSKASVLADVRLAISGFVSSRKNRSI